MSQNPILRSLGSVDVKFWVNVEWDPQGHLLVSQGWIEAHFLQTPLYWFDLHVNEIFWVFLKSWPEDGSYKIALDHIVFSSTLAKLYHL